MPFILRDHTDPTSEQGLQIWLLASSGREAGKNPSNLGHIISLGGGGDEKKNKKKKALHIKLRFGCIS